MIPRFLAVTLAAWLLVDPVQAVDREARRVSWDGFRQEVESRRLAKHNVRVLLAEAPAVKAHLLRVEEDGLVVRFGRSTQQWGVTKGESKIPRSSVTAVYFTDRGGRGRIIGFLAGLGGGAAAGYGAATTGQVEGGGIIAALVLIPVLAGFGGYFIGWAVSKPGPSFLILP